MTTRVQGSEDTADFGLRIQEFEGCLRYCIVNLKTDVVEYFPALLSGALQAVGVLQAELDSVRAEMDSDNMFEKRLSDIDSISMN